MSEDSTNAMSKKRSMTNDELISLASSLFGQASIAHSYDAILKQYMQNLHEYTAEMECSCAFYSISFKALAEGLFIYLARLFDDDGKSLTLRNLLNELGKLSDDDMHPELRKMYFARGEKFQHTLKPIEEVHYPYEVHATKELLAANGMEYRNTMVDLSLHDRIKLFRKRFKALRTPIYNLSQQRNKMLAHNDAETCFEYEKVTTEYYLMFDADMQKEYVFCAYLVKLLPGEPKQDLDLEGALKLEFYKLEETFKGEITLTDDVIEIVPAKGKGASGPEAKEPLEEVIQRINELFDGKFDERDRVILYSLHKRLASDEKLRRVAQTSNPQVFHESIWPKSFGDAAQTGYVEYNEAFASLFQNKSKYNAIMIALGDMLYREFNRSST